MIFGFMWVWKKNITKFRLRIFAFQWQCLCVCIFSVVLVVENEIYIIFFLVSILLNEDDFYCVYIVAYQQHWVDQFNRLYYIFFYLRFFHSICIRISLINCPNDYYKNRMKTKSNGRMDKNDWIIQWIAQFVIQWAKKKGQFEESGETKQYKRFRFMFLLFFALKIKALSRYVFFLRFQQKRKRKLLCFISSEESRVIITSLYVHRGNHLYIVAAFN